jgi:hypothetical protein
MAEPSTPKIKAPILTENKNITKLIHVLVIRAAKSAAARLTLKSTARNTAAMGPAIGNTPAKTPMPNPEAIFCGVSSIFTSFSYISLKKPVIASNTFRFLMHHNPL